MAYVRRRGNQLAIVHGEREPGTGKVQQRILFTVYSKAEALEILGRNDTEKKSGARWFQGLLEREHPDLKFNWKAIQAGVEENMAELPDLYEYRAERLHGRFRQDLCGFAKQLMLADPQHLMSSAHLIQEHRHELEYLVEKIQWCLKLRDQKESQWNTDNPFYWRFALQGREVPPGTAEHAIGYYHRREYDKAQAVFKLLIDCFENYADGYNYLGLIAYDQRKLDEAITYFEKTIEVGRKLFPARIAKKRYWTEMDTRPYMRGLRNLALSLNQVGRFDEALVICDRLENECGDDMTAASNRASVFLNTGRWQEACDAADKLAGLCPEEDLVAAFALFELGRQEDVLRTFLHGALNRPRAARMLLGERTTEPKGFDEIEDHNSGVSLVRDLHAYLESQSRSAKKFFRGLVGDLRVSRLLDDIAMTCRRREEQHAKGDREAFDRLRLMRSPEFANAEASKLLDLIATPAPEGAVVH